MNILYFIENDLYKWSIKSNILVSTYQKYYLLFNNFFFIISQIFN